MTEIISCFSPAGPYIPKLMPIQPRPRAETSRLLLPSLRFCILNPFRKSDWLLRLERRHVDGEAVFHIGLEQSPVSFVDLLNGDDFDISSDVVLAAEVEHVLGLGDA